MNDGWKYAVAGALAGAALSIAIIFASAAAGILPVQLSTPSRDAAVKGYLTAHPEILIEMTDKLQEQQAAEETRARENAVAKTGMAAFFDPKVAFVTGPKDAKTTLVVFFDYNCPYCRASIPAVKKFYEAHKNDARFAFIEFPIKGENSTEAAKAAIAARRQPEKYLAFHFALMNEHELVTPELVFAVAKKTGLDVAKLKADMNDPAINAEIDAAHELARKAGVDGTPTFIINGKVRPGAIEPGMLEKLAKG